MALPTFLTENKVRAGLIWGLVLPFVGVALLMTLDESIVNARLLLPNNAVYMGQKPRTLYLLAICLNLIPFQIFKNAQKSQAFRGVGLVTMVYALAWFAYFSATLLKNT
jgi:hypothetical protein